MQELEVVGAALDLAIGNGTFKNRQEAGNVIQCLGIVEARFKQTSKEKEELEKEVNKLREICTSQREQLTRWEEASKDSEETEQKPGPERNKEDGAKVGPENNKRPQHKGNE